MSECKHEWISLTALTGKKKCLKCAKVEPIESTDPDGKYGMIEDLDDLYRQAYMDAWNALEYRTPDEKRPMKIGDSIIIAIIIGVLFATAVMWWLEASTSR